MGLENRSDFLNNTLDKYFLGISTIKMDLPCWNLQLRKQRNNKRAHTLARTTQGNKDVWRNNYNAE